MPILVRARVGLRIAESDIADSLSDSDVLILKIRDRPISRNGGCTCIPPRTRPRSQLSLVSRVARAWIRPQEKSAGLTAKQRRAPRRTGMRLLPPRAQWLSGGQSARCLSRLTAPLAGVLLEGGYWKRADRSDHLCMQGTRFPLSVLSVQHGSEHQTRARDGMPQLRTTCYVQATASLLHGR